MPDKIYGLSEDDRRELRWAIEQVRKLQTATQGDSVQARYDQPDAYIALTPASGISARDGTTVYSENCSMYKLVDNGDGTGTLTAITIDGNAFALPVWNLAGGAVSGDTYVVTDRLKGGARYVVVESCD